MIAGIVADLGPALGGVAALLAAVASWRSSRRAKGAHRAAEAAEQALGAPNGNGPANQALHVVIEMQKESNRTLQEMSGQIAAMSVQLDELTVIVAEHTKDPLAHVGV